MFFIFGISSAEKKLDFVQTMLCSQCEQFGRLELYMTYTYLSLFFIPVLKWNKKFYVKSTCCNTIYAIDDSIGYKILQGELITIHEQELQIINTQNQSNSLHRCSNCGYMMEQDFLYCPKCGNRI